MNIWKIYSLMNVKFSYTYTLDINTSDQLIQNYDLMYNETE